MIGLVLITYRITRHSNLRSFLFGSLSVLITYRITRHSNIKAFAIS